MTTTQESWPLNWTTQLEAGKSPIAAFDLVEIRSVVDTLRVALGLSPVAWQGRADDDPTFAPGRTPIRAVHFNQLREALVELYDAAKLEPPPPFTGGPIVPRTRLIKLSDTLDLRGWVERYETLRPELAARVVRKHGAYSVPGLADERARGRLAEMWDGAGFSRYFYDEQGRVSRELRVQDGFEYWTSYEHDSVGRLAALTYPDGERISYRSEPALKLVQVTSSWGGALGGPGGSAPTGESVLAEARKQSGEGEVGYDARCRPTRLGDSARPALRLAYDGNGKLVKRADDRGTVHFVGEHYERHLGWGEQVADRVTKYVPSPAGGRWVLLGSPEGERGRLVASARAEARWDQPVWRMPDELWERLRPLLPAETAPRVGGGPPPDDRQTLDAIFHVLRTGRGWSELPPSLGSPAAVRGRFLQWRRGGVFGRLRQAGLGEHEALNQLDWARLVRGGPA